MKTKSPYFYLLIFLFLNVLNFIDRNILFAFGNEIKADFNLTNTQWGLVSGIVFLFFYATCSIFIGALGDRLSRTKIIAFGLFLWSSMTALTGLAKNVVLLFISRAFIGVGESSLTPSSISMLSDVFPKEKRGMAGGIYYFGIPLGVGLGFLIQASLGPIFGWRNIFIGLGVLGALVSIFIYFLTEPIRGEIDGKQNQEKAFSIAYQDVLASFEYFNQNFRNGRPYILAGHSQGSMHALKLLKEIRNNSHLYSDMVAAYLVGFNITKSDIYPTKVCESADSINCVVAWNSVEKNGFITFKSEEDLICVNPLSWNESEKAISSNFNLGGVGFNHWSKNKIKRNWKNIVLEPKVAGAKCKDGNLLITNLYSSGFPVRLFSLHAYDYGLFFSNILNNTKVRSLKFLKVRSK